MGFQPGAKEFVNETGYYLQVTLVVRRGNDPKQSLPDKVSFDMEKSTRTTKQFGDAKNPYLNEIEVKALIAGTIEYFGQLVIERDTAVDIEFNTNDTASFRYEKRELGLVMTKQGSRAVAAEPAWFAFTKLE